MFERSLSLTELCFDASFDALFHLSQSFLIKMTVLNLEGLFISNHKTLVPRLELQLRTLTHLSLSLSFWFCLEIEFFFLNLKICETLSDTIELPHILAFGVENACVFFVVIFSNLNF